jgi:hypothetical protein
MANTPQNPLTLTPPVAWWRVPHVVLMFALLLMGVVAISIMVVISAIGQDPVLDKAVYERELKAAQALQGQARIEALKAAQPANQGRNHAASPVVPAVD